MKFALPLFAVFWIPALLWNHDIFLLINDFNSPLADFILGTIAGLGDGLVSLVLICMLLLFQLRLGLAGLLAFILSGVITQLLKRSFDMPRPPTVFEQVHLLGESLGQHSFPSGHATTCGMMALLAVYMWRHKAWPIVALFVLAAYGRIYGGVHFPLDVVTGFGIGVLSMWWCQKRSLLWPVQRWQQSEWSWKIPGLILMIAAVTLAMGYQIQPATAQALTLIIPVAALVTLMFAWKRHRQS